MKKNIKIFSITLIILCLFFNNISYIYAAEEEEEYYTVYETRIYWNQLLGTSSNYYDVTIVRSSNGDLEVQGLTSNQYVSDEKIEEYKTKLTQELKELYPNGLAEGEKPELIGSTTTAVFVGDNGTTPSFSQRDDVTNVFPTESNWQDLSFNVSENKTAKEVAAIVSNILPPPKPNPSNPDNSGGGGGGGGSGGSGSSGDCGMIITKEVQDEIDKYLNIVKIIVPILLILLGMLDFGKGVLSGNEDEIKKGQQTFIKRCMAAVIILALPLLVNLIIWVINKGADPQIDKCGIPAAHIIFRI